MMQAVGFRIPNLNLAGTYPSLRSTDRLQHFNKLFSEAHVCECERTPERLSSSIFAIHQTSIRRMSKVACMHGTTQKEERTLNALSEATTSTMNKINGSVLRLKKVAIIGKMTRYEFEKDRFKDYSEVDFKNTLASRGSDYDALISQHERHLKTMSSIKEELEQRGIEYHVSIRGNKCIQDLVKWADAIITAGGDGTFLSAASKIKDQTKPVIGINTNPIRSEGHLCLPHKYTSNLGKALDMLATGQFRWLWRQRIRITMTGNHNNFRPVHNGDMLQSRMRSLHSSDNEPNHINLHEIISSAHTETPPNSSGVYSQVLPVLALNEVFIGESLAAVPSYYDLQVDDGQQEEQKSSGLCVCTGTGSTAWSYNICRLHKSAVRRVLEMAADVATPKSENNNGMKNIEPGILDEKFVEEVTNAYSKSYIYAPDTRRMLYSVRDPMQNRVFSCKECNGFAKHLVVRSRCWDAGLCIDGEISYSFNDGAIATLEILPEDALRTVQLFEDDAADNQPELVDKVTTKPV